MAYSTGNRISYLSFTPYIAIAGICYHQNGIDSSNRIDKYMCISCTIGLIDVSTGQSRAIQTNGSLSVVYFYFGYDYVQANQNDGQYISICDILAIGY